MNDTSKVLVALAAGAAVGAVLGILFAPAKGEETRGTLIKKGKELAEDISSRFKCAAENMKEEAFN
jgi:gas vesicle protein